MRPGSNLSRKLKDLPTRPGVYVFKDAKGAVLYVGKAINLRSRVNSYFAKDGGEGRPNVQVMLPQITDLDYTVTTNELESLMLERNFIKQLKPKYNIDLRDDKNYIFLKINLRDEIPTIEFERRPGDRTARYFGPYTSGYAIKETLRLVRKIFPYCANSAVSDKPCFYYHIGKCPGVCFGKISAADYRELYIKKIIQFLLGQQSEVLQSLQQQMKTYARSRQFEQAAGVRNQIFALNRILERQRIISPKKISQDIWGLHRAGSIASLNLFLVREGKLIRKENFILDNANVPPGQILEEFLPRYYMDATDWPKEVLAEVKIELPKMKTFSPTRGQAHDLIRLAAENAKQYLETQSDKHLLEEARLLASLKELQRVLGLPKLPGRIEAYDISNIQGTNPVGSMVVFDFARPKKNDYRKFKINKKQTPDDFAMMSEMLERRFKRNEVKTEGKQRENNLGVPFEDPSRLPSAWPLPDLILIDGGKGQLSSAVKILEQYKLAIPIIGLAKRLEEIFVPKQSTPYNLPPNSQALFLLQRIRDEAHRFAVTFHRKLRSRSAVASVLDNIAGLGPRKKQLILQKFGSPAKVRTASLTDLGRIVGAKLAERIKASL